MRARASNPSQSGVFVSGVDLCLCYEIRTFLHWHREPERSTFKGILRALLADDVLDTETAVLQLPLGIVKVPQQSQEESATDNTNRRVRTDILGDASSFTDGVRELVAKDASRVGRLAVLASATGEHKGVADLVFLGVQHIGTAQRVSDEDL